MGLSVFHFQLSIRYKIEYTSKVDRIEYGTRYTVAGAPDMVNLPIPVFRNRSRSRFPSAGAVTR